ncbi:putative reverse transcriptase domain, ribonuclease H-like domain, aspartic peptidase domain protein [Tanacetum coccineum]
MMQRLLPYGLQQYLPDEVAKPIIELCSFFKQICSATLMEDDMLKAQSKVVDILCNLELIYPPAFFDIMIHLVIHLPLEALEGGPIRPRWMFPFERYMKKLKGYVRNKAKPEGSIAEGYVAEEALTFSSHYFRDVTTKFNRPDRNVDPPPPTCQFQVFRSVCKSIGLRSVIRFDAQELKKVKWYVLHNSPEIDTYRSQFKSLFPNKDMKEEFPDWFGSQIRQRHVDNDKDPEVSTTTSELFALACGLTWTPILINSCVVDGVRYVVHSRDERHITQNSGICSPGPDGEMYYGQLQEILEFKYLLFKVVLFRVKWLDTRNQGRKVKCLILRNNMTQINTRGEAFKNDQYILVAQVKQVFYLEDKAKPYWKVVKHVNHKKFSDGGVIMVGDDPDIIYFDNSSNLPLSTSLNDLDNATLHIDGQPTEVDAPPDIIDVVDEDDDIIDDEDPLPHDLADSDDEDLVNVDDDGVDKMSADVTRSHGGDGGGEDRPPPHHVPTGCMGCFANRGERKPNLGSRAAGRLNIRDKTRNLSLKEITDKKCPVPIRFELCDKQTLMPLGDHAAHWSRYIGEVIRGVPLYYPSWLKVPKERKAALITDIGVIDPTIGTYNVEKIRRARPEDITAEEWDKYIQFWNDPRNIARAAQNWQNQAKSTVISRQGSRSLARLQDEMRQSSATQEYPSLIDTFFVAHTVNGEFLRDEDRRIYEEMRRLEATGTYTDDEINRLARRGKQRGHIPGVGRVLPARATAGPSTPASESTLNSLHKKVDFMMSLFKSDSKYSDMFSQFESGGASGSGGCGDDEESADDQEDEDEDGDGDS